MSIIVSSSMPRFGVRLVATFSILIGLLVFSLMHSYYRYFTPRHTESLQSLTVHGYSWTASNDSTTHQHALSPSPSSIPKSVEAAAPATVSSLWKCNDMFGEGQWVRDTGRQQPFYTNDKCPVLTRTQDCVGNGRPDSGYVDWRWQPAKCTSPVPRFDGGEFLGLMRGKAVGFVGDSVARNHMESLMCMLWQVEVPTNRGNRRMQKWLFRTNKVTIIRVWSAWLVNVTYEAFKFAPHNLAKLHLEVPDDNIMDVLLKVDVLVISSGHWFSKPSAYILGDKLVGGQLWSHRMLPNKPLSSTDAFAIAMRTTLRAIMKHPQYKGLTVLRTYSPDHYGGGAWNTGGSCFGITQPSTDAELVSNSYADLMRQIQLQAYEEVTQDALCNAARIKLMDITPSFAYRADGHPGPYRNSEANKIINQQPHGRLPPQDCLHWCMPGPIDIWNEFLLEIFRQEKNSHSQLMET